MECDNARALRALERSALITCAFGITNPGFEGGADRVGALTDRFLLYTVALAHLARQPTPAAGEGTADAHRP